MAKIRITNSNYSRKVGKIRAGDQIHFAPGIYKRPIVFSGLIGTREKPIILQPSGNKGRRLAEFTSGISGKKAKKQGNKAAYARERAGYYPAIGYLGDEALLTIKNCRYLIIKGLRFRNCWPTAIYIDQSQYIAIDGVEFSGGTIAIGANGIDTRDLIIQNCGWQQDKSRKHKMWNKIPWSRIHGASSNTQEGKVDIKRDFRHFDGDFFRSWNIAGNVIIRENQISDAFNAIHCFNTFDRLAPGVDANGLAFNGGKQSTANILIEKNKFTRIRDNVIEPEYHAWNWVVRHNKIYDCYRPFSFEFERAGYFYIYGNTAAFVNAPSQEMSDKDKKLIHKDDWRLSGSLFKLNGTQKNEGPIYVFNNSWYMATGKGILPNFALGKLMHFNNAMEFGNPKKARMFGKDGEQASAQPSSLQNEVEAEKGRFTRRWKEFQIEMDCDVSNDNCFPVNYRSLGYPVGLAAKQARIAFGNPRAEAPAQRSFANNCPDIIGKAKAITLELPDGSSLTIAGGHNIGADQSTDIYSDFDKLFEFLPDDGWLRNANNR